MAVDDVEARRNFDDKMPSWVSLMGLVEMVRPA